jgi:hypothetical protein
MVERVLIYVVFIITLLPLLYYPGVVMATIIFSAAPIREGISPVVNVVSF